MFFGEIEGGGFEVIEPEFAQCFVGHARLERLWTGGRWSEGPAWFGGGRYLIWSDLPNNRMMRYDETDGSVSVFRAPSGYANGNTVDAIGRLVTCEHLNRRVTRTEHDGSITVLADRYAGKRLNSPNDAVVKSDGSIWFTDPDYGIIADYEGACAEREQAGCNVYRIDPHSGEVICVADDFDHPNGLAFSRMKNSFSSPTVVRPKVPGGPNTFADLTSMPMARCQVTLWCSPPVPQAFSMAFALTAQAVCGPVLPRACNATARTGA